MSNEFLTIQPAVVKKAKALLENPAEYPGLQPHDRGWLRLMVWRYPAFENHVSWGVIENDQNHYLRRVVWVRDPLAIDEPDTYGAEVRIESSVFESLIGLLKAIKFEPFDDISSVGIDGTFNGLSYGDGIHQSCTLRWWGPVPGEWTEINAWFNHAIKQFQALLPEQTVK